MFAHQIQIAAVLSRCNERRCCNGSLQLILLHGPSLPGFVLRRYQAIVSQQLKISFFGKHAVNLKIRRALDCIRDRFIANAESFANYVTIDNRVTNQIAEHAFSKWPPKALGKLAELLYILSELAAVVLLQLGQWDFDAIHLGGITSADKGGADSPKYE